MLRSKNWVLILFVSVFSIACGVKGDPQPPLRPSELGRGKPSFRRATEKVKVEKRSVDPADAQSEDEGEEVE